MRPRELAPGPEPSPAHSPRPAPERARREPVPPAAGRIGNRSTHAALPGSTGGSRLVPGSFPSPRCSGSPPGLLQNRTPALMLIGGEDLLAPARLSPPVPPRGDLLVPARGRRDGRERADPVPRRAHGRRHRQGGRQPLAAGDRSGGRRSAAARVQRRAPDRGRHRLARGGVRPPQPDVPASAVARARLLRRPADRAADVARHGGPPVRPLLPRLRPDLPRPVGDHHRDRGGGHVRPRPQARGGGARSHALRRLDRLPLRTAQPAGHPGGAAAHCRAHRGGRGEHRRRARGQGFRAGGAPADAASTGRWPASSTSR